MEYKIIEKDCYQFLKMKSESEIDFTFLDPPFNQGKKYRLHNDSMLESDYWKWMEDICSHLFRLSTNGAAIYFMQREKNVDYVMNVLRKTGWVFQNLIIWKKKTSAIPSNIRFSKSYQIIVFATKGLRPRVFNKLRIDPPLINGYKPRDNGIYIPDVWDDIRELTSGYYAGDEVIRFDNGERVHNQQSPIALLLRMILSSTNPGDYICDPFCGTGTTLSVALQTNRKSIGIEKDSVNIRCIKKRLTNIGSSDLIDKYRYLYRFTPKLNQIWPEFKNENMEFNTIVA